jgi:hypothetical protein
MYIKKCLHQLINYKVGTGSIASDNAPDLGVVLDLAARSIFGGKVLNALG